MFEMRSGDDMKKEYSVSYFAFLILFLGLMSAFGPFITDMYLPSLPAMSEIFRASASAGSKWNLDSFAWSCARAGVFRPSE